MKKQMTLMKALFAVLLISLTAISAVSAGSLSDAAWIEKTFLNQDPDPAEPGEYVELRWKVEKFGNEELKDITFELIPEYPFSFDESDEPQKNIGDWIGRSDDKEYYTLYYKLRVDDNAIEGDYDVSLRYKIGANTDSWVDEEFTIRVDDKKVPEIAVGSLTSNPKKLMADSNENELNIEILNNGDEGTENVVVELELVDGITSTYSYSTQTNLGNIAAHASKTATFYIDLDETVLEGAYKTNLKVTYKNSDSDDEKTYSHTLPLQLEVKEKPTFEITNVDFGADNITPGNKITLKFNLENTGSKKAESVSVRAYTESTQPFSFDDKSDYIGTLSAKEIGDGSLSFTIDNDATPKKYILDVEIRSIKNGQVFVQEETIPIVIEPKPQRDNSIVTLIIKVVVVLVLIIGAYIYGRGSASKGRRRK